VIVLEAPGGFGKSTLAEQLAVGATTILRLFLEKEDSSSRRLVTRLRDGCRRSHLVAAVEPVRATTRIANRLLQLFPPWLERFLTVGG